MRYFDTFTGIGGFTLGIQQAYEQLQNNEHAHISEESEQEERPLGREWPSDKREVLLHPRDRTAQLCVGFSEIDKYASAIYQHHFPTHKNYGDITKINAEELPDFDLLVGGFPCQAFSIAGKRKGFDDTRGTLFFDLARILRAKQPRLFVFENVKGILSHDSGNTFRTIMSTIAELGYDAQWQVLNSKNHGVPQNRERVYIVGHLRGTRRPEVFPFGENNSENIILPTITTRITADSNGSYIGKGQTHQINQVNNPIHSNDRVYDTDGISPTLNTMQGGNRQPFVVTRNDGMEVEMDIANSVTPDAYLTSGKRGFDENGKTKLTSMCDRRIRRLTPIECERLQAFPDNWTNVCDTSDSQRYKCCGNAVTVNVVRDVMMKLI